jgi:hypothetical protein
MGELYRNESVLNVALVTFLLGGGAAWLAGRAIAETWRPIRHAIAAMLLLGAAVRFVHFALFQAELLSLPSYIADAAFLLVTGCLAWRATRARQMATQYPWLYTRTGPLTWRRVPTAAPEGNEK